MERDSRTSIIYHCKKKKKSKSKLTRCHRVKGRSPRVIRPRGPSVLWFQNIRKSCTDIKYNSIYLGGGSGPDVFYGLIKTRSTDGYYIGVCMVCMHRTFVWHQQDRKPETAGRALKSLSRIRIVRRFVHGWNKAGIM